MKSTVETLEPTKAKLVVEVDYDELKPAMDKAYKEIASQANIPGFRKGHIPPRVIDQRYGRGAVIEQAVNETLPRFLSDAVIENKLRPLAEPQVEVKTVPNIEGEPGGVLEFEAILNIVPDFEFPELDGIEVEVDPIVVADEDVDKELLELQGRFATLKNLDRAAEDGDFLSLDISATVDGEEIDQLSDVSYELGSGTMLDGQDEALRGASVGDEITFTSAILGGEHAGQDAKIDVVVKAVKERELPDVDDDFAQMVSEFDTAEELRADTAKQVGEQKKGAQALQARDLVLDYLLDNTEILLPAEVVDHEVSHRVDEDADEEAKAAVRTAIERDIRQQILLDTLAQERKVQVSQQELVDFMMQAARNFGMDLNQLLSDQGQVQSMYGELARTKGLVSVLAGAKVTDSDGAAVDLSAFTVDRAEAEAKAAAAAAAAQAAEAATAGGDDTVFSLSVDDIPEGDAE